MGASFPKGYMTSPSETVDGDVEKKSPKTDTKQQNFRHLRDKKSLRNFLPCTCEVANKFLDQAKSSHV